jgi:ADP-ribosylglycohydrolase
VSDVRDWSGECGDWRDAWELVMGKYGGYHWVHTINNAAFVLLGLLYGGGDLWETVSVSVMAGFDTDCNGATAGSIVGAVLGARALPNRWVAPLDDRVKSALSGFAESSISGLARRTCDVGERVVERFS